MTDDSTRSRKIAAFLSARRETLLVLAIALAARLAWWAAWVSIPENEGMQYMRRAENWLAGAGYVNLQGARDVMATPLYPALIAGVSVLVGSLELAPRLVSLASGLATVVLVGALTRRAFGTTAGRVAGVFAALHPVLVGLSVSMYGESLAMSLTLAALYFAARALESSSVWWVPAAGAAVGFCYLTRPELIALLGPIAAYLVFFRARAGRWKRGVCEAGVVALVALALAAPYSIYLSGVAGSFRWQGKTAPNELINARIERGMSFMEASRGLDVDRDFARFAPYLGGPDLWADQAAFFGKAERRSASEHARSLLKRVPDVVELLWSTGKLWGSTLKLPFGLAALLLALTLSRWWQRSGSRDALLLLSVLGLQAAVLLGVRFLWARYAYPLVPLVIPWVSFGAVWAADGVLRRLRPNLAEMRRERWVTLLGVGAVIVMSAEACRRVVWLDDFRQSTDSVVREAGLWLRDQPRRGDRQRPLIMTVRSGIVHYTGGNLTYLPYTNDVPRALRYIHWKRPDFIAVSSEYLGSAPYLEAWVERGIPDPCAVPLRRFESPRSTVVLWRWNCEN